MNSWPPSPRLVILALGLIGLLFCTQTLIGITWGLPTRNIDQYLFGGREPWPGEKIYRLAGAAERFDSGSARRGADVDIDPLTRGDEPILLTGTDADLARIYLRYRLYTHQPDEMITLMALSGMSPSRLDFDPRLYQYGGLFLYPVGALIQLCDVLGLIDVRGDVVYYLDHPDEFGKFYVVARLYAAAWGLLGVFVVFAITRRLAGNSAALLAALFFALLPVVVCMSHEGKPHLPGAVLMLCAVWFAMRYLHAAAPANSPTSADVPPDPPGLDSTATALGSAEKRASEAAAYAPAGSVDWWMCCICCGAAFGMVLSSLPIFVLIPLVAFLDLRRRENLSRSQLARRWLGLTTAGVAVASAVYLLTNPYILINAFANPEVLRSNFGNSLAMYEISRVGEGFRRVVELTVEGATLPITLLGFAAVAVALIRRNAAALPLAVPAAMFFIQFVLIGAGKPGEYGRFGIFPDTALAIGAAAVLVRPWSTRFRPVVNGIPAVLTILWLLPASAAYLWNFRIDANPGHNRAVLAYDANALHRWPGDIEFRFGVLAEPAPYGCPPIDFARHPVWLYRSMEHFINVPGGNFEFLIQPIDAPIWTSDTGLSGSDLSLQSFDHVVQYPAGGWSWPPPTPISWANKPFLASTRGVLRHRADLGGAPPPEAN